MASLAETGGPHFDNALAPKWSEAFMMTVKFQNYFSKDITNANFFVHQCFQVPDFDQLELKKTVFTRLNPL